MNRPPILIGLYGKARSGKDTAAAELAMELDLLHYSFASPLKEMLTSVFGDNFVNGDRERICPETGVSYRVMMQTLGTEWGRALNPDVWVNLVERRWKEVLYQGRHADTYRAAFNADPRTGMVLSDIRFDSEAKWLKYNGGRLIEIHRPDLPSISGVVGHASEAGISNEFSRTVLINDGSLADLRAKLATVVEMVRAGATLPKVL